MNLVWKKRISQIGQAQGVIIPKIWLDQHELSKGSNVELILDNDGNLLIKPI